MRSANRSTFKGPKIAFINRKIFLCNTSCFCRACDDIPNRQPRCRTRVEIRLEGKFSDLNTIAKDRGWFKRIVWKGFRRVFYMCYSSCVVRFYEDMSVFFFSQKRFNSQKRCHKTLLRLCGVKSPDLAKDPLFWSLGILHPNPSRSRPSLWCIRGKDELSFFCSNGTCFLSTTVILHLIPNPV